MSHKPERADGVPEDKDHTSHAPGPGIPGSDAPGAGVPGAGVPGAGVSGSGVSGSGGVAGWDGVWFGGPRAQPEWEWSPHGFVSITPGGYPRVDGVRGPLPLLRAARHPYLPEGAAQGRAVALTGLPVRLAFRTGGKGRTALHHAPDEYTRQLARQQDGLNAMTAVDYLRGREVFLTHGRGNGQAERDAREEFREHLVKQNEKAGLMRWRRGGLRMRRCGVWRCCTSRIRLRVASGRSAATRMGCRRWGERM